MRDAERGGEAYVFRCEAPALRQGRITSAYVFAALAPVSAEREARGQRDGTVLEQTAILLHEDGVQSFRHGRAGEDAHGGGALQRRLRRMSRRHAAADREDGLGARRQIAEANRITVDGRIVEARQIDRRDERLGENAPLGGKERNTLESLDAWDARE